MADEKLLNTFESDRLLADDVLLLDNMISNSISDTIVPFKILITCHQIKSAPFENNEDLITCYMKSYNFIW
jgi:hypothetical protein